MSWWLIILLAPVLLVGLLWVAYQIAQQSPHQTYLIPRPFYGDHVEVRIYIGQWWGYLFPGNAVAFRHAIWLDVPGTRPANVIGKVTPRRALLHEMVHACYQADRMRLGYLPTYLWHRIVLRKAWQDHPMEREATRLGQGWLDGDRSLFGTLPADLLAAFPVLV